MPSLFGNKDDKPKDQAPAVDKDTRSQRDKYNDYVVALVANSTKQPMTFAEWAMANPPKK